MARAKSQNRTQEVVGSIPISSTNTAERTREPVERPARFVPRGWHGHLPATIHASRQAHASARRRLRCSAGARPGSR